MMTSNTWRRSAGVIWLAGTLCLGCSDKPSGPGRTPSTEELARFEGYHDVTNCNGMTGWAWDPDRPDEALIVDVYDGNLLLAGVVADGFRTDLLNTMKGNGKHAFLLPTPEKLKDGKPHYIYMKYGGTQFDLRHGPKEITCPASR